MFAPSLSPSPEQGRSLYSVGPEPPGSDSSGSLECTDVKYAVSSPQKRQPQIESSLKLA